MVLNLSGDDQAEEQEEESEEEELDREELLDELAEETDEDRETLKENAKKIEEQYDGLVSPVSSVILLAKREYSIDLVSVEGPDLSLDVTNITPDMDSVDLEAKVEYIKDAFSFGDDEGDRGREVRLYDDTGGITLMLWGEQVGLADELEKDNTVILENGYAKEYKGETQISLGNSGTLYLVENGEKERLN